jgi:hypothetical protein
MVTARPYRVLAVVALAVTIAGCSSLIPNADQGLLPGGRRWIITVENQSAQPAVIVVAEDTMPMGPVVGRVTPGTIPPLTAIDVTFDIPAGRTWAIWINPGRPDEGPLFTAPDVPPGVVGKLPITISISPDGMSGASLPNGLPPGWFGN